MHCFALHQSSSARQGIHRQSCSQHRLLLHGVAYDYRTQSSRVDSWAQVSLYR